MVVGKHLLKQTVLLEKNLRIKMHSLKLPIRPLQSAFLPTVLPLIVSLETATSFNF